MKLEFDDEDKYAPMINGGNYQRFNCNMMSNVPLDLEFYNMSNIGVSRVDQAHGFFDDEKKSSTLLNLDNQNKKKTGYETSYEEESPFKKLLQSSYHYKHENEEMEIDYKAWETKPVEEWSIDDTKNWLMFTGAGLGQPYGEMSPNLAMPGRDLLRLTRPDFLFYDPHFGGRLHDKLCERQSMSYLPSFRTIKSYSDDETSLGSGNNYSDGESLPDQIKKRPGRPRILDPKRKAVKEKLWEFVRRLLLNPEYCPRLICWDDYRKKRFRFVQSDTVAKLWGDRKNNKSMTYEKFSRAMRYYYSKGIFVAVPGRRLVYEFGTKATGLETDNPNFDRRCYENGLRSKY